MATHAKGLICVPMSGELIDKAGLNQMVSHRTDNHVGFHCVCGAVDTTTVFLALGEELEQVEFLVGDDNDRRLRRSG